MFQFDNSLDVIVPIKSGTTTSEFPTLKITDRTNNQVLWRHRFEVSLFGENCKISPNVNGTWRYEDELSVTVTPNEKTMGFSRWSDDVKENPRTIVVSSDINLTAYCEVVNYTITYDSNYGTIQTKTFSEKQSMTHTVKSQSETFSRSGYTITEWNTKRDGTGKTYRIESTFEVYSDLTLYAQWKISHQTYIEQSSYNFNTSVTLEPGTYNILAHGSRGDGHKYTNISPFKCTENQDVVHNGGTGASIDGTIKISKTTTLNITDCVKICGGDIDIEITSGKDGSKESVGEGGKIISIEGFSGKSSPGGKGTSITQTWFWGGAEKTGPRTGYIKIWD